MPGIIAHAKKRVRSSDSDIEDHDYRSHNRDKNHYWRRERLTQDALADFRAEVSEEEAASRKSKRRAEPTHPDDTRHRGRDLRAHDERESRHRDHSRSRSYKENRRNSDRYTAEDMPHEQDRERRKHSSHGRHSSPGWQATHVSQESYRHHRHFATTDEGEHLEPSGRSKRSVEGSSSRAERPFEEHRQEERRGRSLSRSSSTRSNSRHLSSRSASRSSEESRRYSRKRRRRRSYSRSFSRERKDSKSRKHKGSSSRRKDRDRERSDSRRSVLTGKKIKLKVKKDKGDDERDAKRQELLKFLNSAYE
ncbi:hypothetical protein NP233_g8456 [Leucocoprinus birnbaumii]|uniref:Uncharacterized protein n=1 Tax=Leucocoprinus birnbaumii TaxID=56174 RepID=A0AAD5VME7_9AGAR|nr:hypothetical protein NP233_g8456 [Leucocoprinus birnbaumii]